MLYKMLAEFMPFVLLSGVDVRYCSIIFFVIVLIYIVITLLNRYYEYCNEKNRKEKIKNKTLMAQNAKVYYIDDFYNVLTYQDHYDIIYPIKDEIDIFITLKNNYEKNINIKNSNIREQLFNIYSFPFVYNVIIDKNVCDWRDLLVIMYSNKIIVKKDFKIIINYLQWKDGLEYCFDTEVGDSGIMNLLKYPVYTIIKTCDEIYERNYKNNLSKLIHRRNSKHRNNNLKYKNYIQNMRDTKQEEVILEDTKLNDTNLEDIKLEEIKQDTKLEEIKQDTKLEDIKLEEIKLDITKLEETKLEEIKQDTKLEEIKQETKLDDTKLEDTKQEIKQDIKLEGNIKLEDIKQENIQNENNITKEEYESKMEIIYRHKYKVDEYYMITLTIDDLIKASFNVEKKYD